MGYVASLGLILGTWALALGLVPLARRRTWALVPVLSLGCSGSIIAVLLA